MNDDEAREILVDVQVVSHALEMLTHFKDCLVKVAEILVYDPDELERDLKRLCVVVKQLDTRTLKELLDR
jgi:hypothetical protein